MFDEISRNIKKISISSYLEGRGVQRHPCTKGKSLFSSPFSSDSNPSFYVYENQNTFYDFSTGKGGDIISLVMELDKLSYKEALNSICNGELLPISIPKKREVSKSKEDYKGFNLNKFITERKDYIYEIEQYAKGRLIYDNYYPAVIKSKTEGVWKDNLAMMFSHVDEDMDICGAKFRFINNSQRFTARGRLYISLLGDISSSNEDSVLYLVESETSANSLNRILNEYGSNHIVVSIGAISSSVKDLPEVLDKIPNKKLIIDYDGNEKLYRERLERLSHLGEPIKMPFSKGEDINSLYCEGKVERILEFLNLN